MDIEKILKIVSDAYEACRRVDFDEGKEVNIIDEAERTKLGNVTAWKH